MSYPAQQFSRTPPRPLTPEQLRRRFAGSYPESMGPGTDHESDLVTYGEPGHPRIGSVPHLLDPATRDRENAERERRRAAMTDAEPHLAEAEAVSFVIEPGSVSEPSTGRKVQPALPYSPSLPRRTSAS